MKDRSAGRLSYFMIHHSLLTIRYSITPIISLISVA